MVAGAARSLTARQRAVMERIDRRVPIKVIAQDLGVSETRINQHIRALKDIYDAASLGELVKNYRLTQSAAEVAMGEAMGFAEALPTPLSEAEYSKNQVNAAAWAMDRGGEGDPGQLMMSDAMSLIDRAPWLRPGEVRVVPGVLDGEHAVLFRLGAILAIAMGVLAAVVLTVTAARTLTEATQDTAAVSEA